LKKLVLDLYFRKSPFQIQQHSDFSERFNFLEAVEDGCFASKKNISASGKVIFEFEFVFPR